VQCPERISKIMAAQYLHMNSASKHQATSVRREVGDDVTSREQKQGTVVTAMSLAALCAKRQKNSTRRGACMSEGKLMRAFMPACVCFLCRHEPQSWMHIDKRLVDVERQARVRCRGRTGTTVGSTLATDRSSDATAQPILLES
jgi:hypothetical protein